MQKFSKYTSWVLYALMIITVVVFALFYFGGYVNPDAEMLEPVYTDAVLDMMYATVIIGIILAVLFSIFQFGALLKDNTKKALGNIAILVGFALIFVISWFVGSGEPLNLPAYDGTDNVFFWLKLTDMWLYTGYFLMAASILAIAGFSLFKLIRK
jgi:magnesium-transporting ATPase (P-type)